MNVERGFKRITWIISSFGLIAMGIGLVVIIVNASNLANRMNEIDKMKPQFLEFQEEGQKNIMKVFQIEMPNVYTIDDVIDIKRQEAKKNYSFDDGLGALIGGAVGFVFVWIIFLTLRWIIRGFQGKE